MKWKFWASNSDVLRALAASEQRILNAISKQGEKIMGNTNQAEAALLAGEDKLESDFQKLGAAVAAEVKDATDEIKNLLANTVLNPSVVTAVTSRMAALSANIQSLTSTTAAADPGPQTAPPPATPPASTPPADNPPA